MPPGAGESSGNRRKLTGLQPEEKRPGNQTSSRHKDPATGFDFLPLRLSVSIIPAKRLMISALCTMTLGMLGIRSLALMLFERARPALVRILDLFIALFFLSASALAFVFLGVRLEEHPGVVILSLIIPGILITLSLLARIRRPYQPRPYFLAVKIILTLLLIILTLIIVMTSGFAFLTEDAPLYRITMSGQSRAEKVEWKAPAGTLRSEPLPAYEVKIETPDDRLVAIRYVYGDQVAVKAKVLRLKPILNAMGIRNLYRIDYIYNGYTTAARHNTYPHRAQEIETTHPLLQPFQERFWDYWENSYFLRARDPWVKSATLESTFFPLVNPDGSPFRGSYFLTLTPGGLSAVPLP
jgi:hypothetical protein